MRYETWILSLVVLVAGCGLFDSDRDEVLEARRAAQQEVFPYFAPFNFEAGTVFDFDNIQFGPGNGINRLNDSLLQAAIPRELLERATFIHPENNRFDSTYEYFAIGSFDYEDSLEAYLVGAYQQAVRHTLHLFFYDKSQRDFTQTQSLSFRLNGARYTSQRRAWFYDIDGNGLQDVVYLLEESFFAGEETQSFYIQDSLLVETWRGKNFAPMYNYDKPSLRLALGLDSAPIEGEGENPDASNGLSEFH